MLFQLIPISFFIGKEVYQVSGSYDFENLVAHAYSVSYILYYWLTHKSNYSEIKKDWPR